MNLIAALYFGTLLTIVFLGLFVVESLTTKNSVSRCFIEAFKVLVVGGVFAFLVASLIYFWHVGMDLPVSHYQ